jgi:hypothetical protein
MLLLGALGGRLRAGGGESWAADKGLWFTSCGGQDGDQVNQANLGRRRVRRQRGQLPAVHPPSFTPRFLAAAKPCFVRCEISAARAAYKWSTNESAC